MLDSALQFIADAIYVGRIKKKHYQSVWCFCQWVEEMGIALTVDVAFITALLFFLMQFSCALVIYETDRLYIICAATFIDRDVENHKMQHFSTTPAVKFTVSSKIVSSIIFLQLIMTDTLNKNRSVGEIKTTN